MVNFLDTRFVIYVCFAKKKVYFIHRLVYSFNHMYTFSIKTNQATESFKEFKNIGTLDVFFTFLCSVMWAHGCIINLIRLFVFAIVSLHFLSVE